MSAVTSGDVAAPNRANPCHRLHALLDTGTVELVDSAQDDGVRTARGRVGGPARGQPGRAGRSGQGRCRRRGDRTTGDPHQNRRSARGGRPGARRARQHSVVIPGARGDSLCRRHPIGRVLHKEDRGGASMEGPAGRRPVYRQRTVSGNRAEVLRDGSRSPHRAARHGCHRRRRSDRCGSVLPGGGDHSGGHRVRRFRPGRPDGVSRPAGVVLGGPAADVPRWCGVPGTEGTDAARCTGPPAGR